MTEILCHTKKQMLKNKVAIVTGAASGIGLATAEMLSKEGTKIMMADVNEEKLSEEAKKLKAKYFCGDLSKREDCKKLVENTVEEFGKVDVLINVAGIQTVCPVEDFSEDKWDFMISLMLTAPFLLTKYCWPSMKEQNWGRIINLNSIHGIVASEYKSAYVSAKHGLTGLTKTAAMEGGAYGITVNSICPAYVKTPLVAGQIADQAKNHNITEEEVIQNVMLSKAAVKKMINPDAITGLIKMLCSENGDNITGTAIPVDGGWTAN
ncbi:MAG: 3-hydroxybutyrate dehydrogenase [Anaerovoracaceae bacterium]